MATKQEGYKEGQRFSTFACNNRAARSYTKEFLIAPGVGQPLIVRYEN